MRGQILVYLGKSHAAYLHARGKLATYKIIELLDPQKEEKILEVGFGTGATLVELASRCIGGFFWGYELSELMIQKASERIQFCRLTDNINLRLLEKKNKFPASDHTFDKVYAESILAIQEGDDFKAIFLEIKRVLKPNGILIFNETIWLESTDKKVAKHINDRSKHSFGIIQSNHDYPYPDHWKKLLTEIGFEYELQLPVSEIREIREKRRISVPLLLSKIYTLAGKMKASLSGSMRKEWSNYKKEMSSIMNTNEKLMQGIIVKAYNRVDDPDQ